MVTLQTNYGDITLELYEDKAPNTVANFKQYVSDEFYNGTVFHRIISNFMIQGGGFTEDGDEKETRAPIDNEADNGLKNNQYTLAMARTSDPHSATAQFFINVTDNDFLNFKAPSGNAWGYCVFGKVISGEDVVEKIKSVPVSQEKPIESVVIEKAYVTQ